VPDVALDRGDREFRGVLAEHDVDRPRLGQITRGRRGGVRDHRVHGLRARQARVTLRAAHGLGLPPAGRLRRGGMEPFGQRGVPGDQTVDVRAAPGGPL
jgi:hypothetical protein